MLEDIKVELRTKNLNESYIDSINGQMLKLETQMKNDNENLQIALR